MRYHIFALLCYISQSSEAAVSSVKHMTSRVDLLTSFQKASNGFDMRGVVESSAIDINKLDGPLLKYETAFWVGVGQWLKKSADKVQSRDDSSLCVGIGRDSRGSGSELTRWLAGGLESVGVRAYDVGLCTTPAMYLSCIDNTTGVDDSTKRSPWPFNGAVLCMFIMYSY
jgi:hypothetical protein